MVANSKTEYALRKMLKLKGFNLSKRLTNNGANGVDIIAVKGKRSYYIEVIGYKKSGPARSRDFFQVFFRAISRIKDGAKHCVIALPRQWQNGLAMRVYQYGIAWQRIGTAFPEVELWFVDVSKKKLERYRWNDFYH